MNDTSTKQKPYIKFCLVTTSPLIVQFFLIPHLRKLVQHYEVTLIVNEDCSKLLAHESLEAIEMKIIPIKRKISPFTDLISFFKLFIFFRQRKFNAIVTVAPKAGLLGILAATLAGCRIRCHIFQGEVWANKHGVKKWLLKSLDKLMASFATHLLVVSQSERTVLIKEGVIEAEKSKVIGAGSICGVDTNRFHFDKKRRAELRAEIGVSEQALLILYLGRVTKDKGVSDLAQAWNSLANRHSNLHLAIVGPDEGNLKAEITNLVSRGNAGKIHFFGHTFHPEFWLTAADMLALPSYREGFGMVVIEAGSVGIPVVASRIYGISDAMIDGVTGLTHTPGNIPELERRLDKLIVTPSLRKQFGEAARTRVIREFEQEVVIDQYISYWESIISKTQTMKK